MDMKPHDRDFLVNSITTNSAVLFLGAGFSVGAINKFGKPIPLAKGFSEILWEFLGYGVAYDGTSLQTVFESALKRKHAEVQRILDGNFQCSKIPDWYNFLPQVFWYRIYTTNIDDLVESVFRKSASGQNLQPFNALTDDYRERDRFLDTIQYIKLNGTLTNTPTSITFSLSQYGDRLSNVEVWYDQFIRDYATRPTVFIGTELDEPMFWQALSARGKRFPKSGRLSKSFLVSPKISPAKLEALKDFNVVPLEGTAQEFFTFLANVATPLPTLQEVVLKTNPNLDVLLGALGGKITGGRRRDIEEFYACFRPIRLQPANPHYHSFFLYGSEPQWEDIYNDYDAPRGFTNDVIKAARDCVKSKEVSLLAIPGSAGSGKSTTLKRIAVQLSSSGIPVFFTQSEQLPPLHHFEHTLDHLPGESVIIFDNANLAMSIMPDYLSAAKRASKKHTFIIAGRANKLVERIPSLKAHAEVKEFPMPDLSLNDVDSIINVLERTHMLGKLANMPKGQQRDVFLSYAHNQILVAMRRATLGHGFDEIIKNEFLTAEPVEAKMLYLCASLVTEAQSTISKQQLLRCADLPPAEVFQLVHENLRGMMIPILSKPDHYTARHRVIAGLIVDQFAPRKMLKEAYIVLLRAIAHDLPIGVNSGSSIIRLYRRLVNHATIYNRFSEHLSEARSIYASLTKSFARDHHFWLQFGSLELEYGELDSAANYIEQAYKFAPDDALVLTTRAHLRYKQSLIAGLFETARGLRDEARQILFNQIASRPQDTYPCHIYCTQELAWINRWLSDKKQQIKALDELRVAAKQMFENHAFSQRLKDIWAQIQSAYLDLAKPEAGNHFNPVLQ